MSDAEQIASQVKEALMIDEYFSDKSNWDRVLRTISDLSENTDGRTMEAAADIGNDMLTEWGLYTDENVDIVHEKLHRLFGAAFLLGNAYRPENDGDGSSPHNKAETYVYTTGHGQEITLIGDVPPSLFADMLDKATDAFIEWIEDQTPVNKAYRDMAIEMLKGVLPFEGPSAYHVVLRSAFNVRKVNRRR